MWVWLREIPAIRIITVAILVVCSTLPSAFADENQGIPSGWESYKERPDILNVPAGAHNLGSNWESLRAAHFSFIAELLAMYPKDVSIYFLARDSELLYDTARLVTQGTSDFDRIQLLNVSRANMRNTNIESYLAQNGISEESLKSGKKVLFVDTGFSGTIPRVIAENFSNEANKNINTHLVVSSNSSHPSSRVFLIHINPSINGINPSAMHGTVVSYEHMPRYTDRSSQFVLLQGEWYPISPVNGAEDGTVSKSKALEYMQDLKAYWENKETKDRFQSEKEQIQILKEVLNKNDKGEIEELKERLSKNKDTFEASLLEAQVRDIVETSKLNLGSTLNVELNLASDSSEASHSSKKNEYIKKYPEWAPVLENPESGIQKLFQEKNWQLIGNLIDANIDGEINGIIIRFLFDELSTGPKKSLQISMIEKGNMDVLQELARLAFSKPHTKDMTDLIRLTIEKGSVSVLQYLAAYTFSQPHTKDMTDLIRLTIEKGDMSVLQYLAAYTFSQPHTKDMTDLIRLMIEKGNMGVLWRLSTDTFSQPHTKDMADLIRLMIEKGDMNVLRELAMNTFSQPHTKDMADLIRLTIEKGNMDVLQELAMNTFSKPHTKDMTDLIRLTIEKGDMVVLQSLARYTFSRPHTKEMADLIRLTIEKGSVSVLQYLAAYTFSQPHTKEMADLIRLTIEKGDMVVLQSLARYTFSRPHTKDMADLIRLTIEKGNMDVLRHLAQYTLSQSHTQNSEYDVLRRALAIADPVERKRWMDQRSPKEITAALEIGNIVEIEAKKFKVISKAGDGRRAIVFKLQGDNEVFYALKVAKNNDVETLASIAKESSKAQAWQSLQIPHSQVLAQRKSYVLKTWIEGISGETLMNEYAAGNTSYQEAVEKLLALVETIRSKGAYIGDFRPANLIWSGQRWVIVDSGSIQQGMTFEEAKRKWEQIERNGKSKFERRWNLPLPAGMQCKSLFAS